MLRAKLKQLLNGDNSQDALLRFVDESMKVAERKALLEVRLSFHKHGLLSQCVSRSTAWVCLFWKTILSNGYVKLRVIIH